MAASNCNATSAKLLDKLVVGPIISLSASITTQQNQRPAVRKFYNILTDVLAWSLFPFRAM
jgi:hypothetical protein